MPDENTPVGTGAPAAPVAPPQAPPVPAAQPTPAVIPPDQVPSWLEPRLAEARTRLLQELGVTDVDAAKAAIKAAADAVESQKSAAQKLGETLAERNTLKTEAERLRGVTSEWAARQMMGLSPEQQAAVKAIAGDDAAAQLKAITALAPTWAKAPAGSPVAVAPVQPAPPASGTAPPPTAPTSGSVSQQTPVEIHAGLVKTNPFTAAEYAVANVREVFPEPK